MKGKIKMSKPHFVGVDDGHYSIKLIGDNKEMITIPSRGLQGRHVIAVGDDDGSFYQTEGVAYTVNEYLQNAEDTRFADYPKSHLNRVLVHHALRLAGFGGKNVSIATGLPVSYYYLNSGDKNDILINAKVGSLNKPVTSGKPTANIVSNMVTTEAIAAYFDQLMDMDGQPSADYQELSEAMVGVIDVGGKTTDCAVVYPGGQAVDNARSGSNDNGVLKLNSAIDSKLRIAFELDNVVPRMIESAIRNGTVKIAGELQDVSAMVNEEKQKLADAIMSGVRTKIGSGKDLDFVLFVGGGAIVLRDQLASHYPHARFPDRPEFANARGMYKIAKYVFGSEE